VLSVYVIVEAVKVAMSLNPVVAWRLRLTTSLLSLLELSVQERVTLLEETLVALRLVGGEIPPFASAAQTPKMMLQTPNSAAFRAGLPEFRGEGVLITGLAISDGGFFNCTSPAVTPPARKMPLPDQKRTRDDIAPIIPNTPFYVVRHT
jgi:hypothetical protein